MNSSSSNTPARANYTTALKAVRKRRHIAQTEVFYAGIPNSSHLGTRIIAPPIPMIAPISPAKKADLANMYISSAVYFFSPEIEGFNYSSIFSFARMP